MIAAGELHRRRLGGIGQQLVEGDHAGRRRGLFLRRQPDKLAHLGAERGGGARGLGEAGVGRQHFGAGVLEDEGRLLRLEHEVDRHQHGAEPRQRKTQAPRRHGELRARMATRVPLPMPRAARPAARRSHSVVEFRVAPGGVAADDRGLVGKALGAAMQQIRQRLAAKRGVHVIPPQCFYGVDYAQVIRPSAGRLPWPRR